MKFIKIFKLGIFKQPYSNEKLPDNFWPSLEHTIDEIEYNSDIQGEHVSNTFYLCYNQILNW